MNIISSSRDRKDGDDVVMMMMARDLDGALRHLSNVSGGEKVKKVSLSLVVTNQLHNNDHHHNSTTALATMRRMIVLSAKVKC